jgi:hypothetical protein
MPLSLIAFCEAMFASPRSAFMHPHRSWPLPEHIHETPKNKSICDSVHIFQQKLAQHCRLDSAKAMTATWEWKPTR